METIDILIQDSENSTLIVELKNIAEKLLHSINKKVLVACITYSGYLFTYILGVGIRVTEDKLSC